MPNPINLLDHPVSLQVPQWRAFSTWLEHTPFAMWLTSVLKPRVLVELGTFYGGSYCAFCQAIAALDLSTRAFAVDTWEGDPHSGPIAREGLDSLRSHHDAHFARFSTLLRMAFDDAVARFADKEVDLLHIDGYHTYDVVRHDFETWRPKMSDRGIILFHDVEERRADFGVWRLWGELISEYPSFTFLHEHGLGVLVMGPDVPDELRALSSFRGPEIEPVRALFREMGWRIRLAAGLETGLAERDAARAERDAASAERDRARAELEKLPGILASLHAAQERSASLERELTELHASQSWRAFHQLALMGSRVAPAGTRRRIALKRVARWIEVLAREGVIELARRQVHQAIDRATGRRRRDVTRDLAARDASPAHAAATGGTPHSNRRDSHDRVRGA
jgi:hypothetical protein